MGQILDFVPRARSVNGDGGSPNAHRASRHVPVINDSRLPAAAENDIPPCGEVVEWCLMILAQTDETELVIPLAKSYSANTIYEVICDFKQRGWIVTKAGPGKLKFQRA